MFTAAHEQTCKKQEVAAPLCSWQLIDFFYWRSKYLLTFPFVAFVVKWALGVILSKVLFILTTCWAFKSFSICVLELMAETSGLWDLALMTEVVKVWSFGTASYCVSWTRRWAHSFRWIRTYLSELQTRTDCIYQTSWRKCLLSPHTPSFPPGVPLAQPFCTELTFPHLNRRLQADHSEQFWDLHCCSLCIS